MQIFTLDPDNEYLEGLYSSDFKNTGAFNGFSYRQLQKMIGGFMKIAEAYAYFKSVSADVIPEEVSEINDLYKSVLDSITVVSKDIGKFKQSATSTTRSMVSTFSKISGLNKTRLEVLSEGNIYRILRDDCVERLIGLNRYYYLYSEWTQYLYTSLNDSLDGDGVDLNMVELKSIITNSKKLHVLLEEQGWV
jgi:hypothetical protein